MDWLLLNQLCVPMQGTNSNSCVLEEVISSELQLVQVLVSGRMSFKTMISLAHSLTWFNQTGLEDLGVAT